ncbi:response regulator [archaeon]|nr:response regulator [archaeon]MBL7057324.1 response regulator [Candidatus Woesearchaeota archaeon]
MNKILIIEDDENWMRFLNGHLKNNLDVNISCYETVVEGIDNIVGDEKVILSDIYTPNGIGFNVVDYVVKKHPHIPVILMSADQFSNIEVQRMITNGAYKFIEKMYGLAEITKTIGKILEN